MIANSSILTSESHNYDIEQFYNAPSALINDKHVSSLYSFIAFKQPWDETLLTSNVSDTIIVREGGIVAGSNSLAIINESSLSDFFINQLITSDAIPSGTRVASLDEDLMVLYLTNPATNTYIGQITFSGVNQNDLVTISSSGSSTALSNKVDFYKGSAIYIDVENVSGGLTYTKTITSYDPITQTIRVDTPFTDYPPLTNSSKIRIYNDNKHPPKPLNTVKYNKQVFKDMVYIKKLIQDDFSPVIERINWTSGLVYDYYRDDIDIREKDSYGRNVNKFYVMNSFYQVFKCLWNNNGGVSTVEPYFVSGSYDDITNVFYDPEDGYKWKYMYTVSGSKIQKFLDSNYIPVPLTSAPDVIKSTEQGGGIEVINVINSGNGYNDLISPVFVNITGDGTGAVARAEVDRTLGIVQNVVLTNPGKNYTFANVSITSATGANSTAIVGLSPIGGSGQDIIAELGCDKLMVAAYYNQNDDYDLPSDLQIRQVGILSNPLSYSTYPDYANVESALVSTGMITSTGFGEFTRGEIIFQAQNNSLFSNASFIATCVDFDPYSNKLELCNVYGTPKLNASLYGKSSGCLRTLLSVTTRDIIKFSGRILYVQNVEEIQRGPDSIELFRILLNF